MKALAAVVAGVIRIDGSDGGGQIVRTAVALAALVDRPVRLTSARGARDPPGLRAQHLAAVRAVAAATDASVEGAEIGSETLVFRPDGVHGGEVSVDVATAGSVALVFDAVLPLAARLDEPLRVTATGGTAVKWAPSLAYLRDVKLPLLRRHGLAAVVERDRPGFYPAGSGRATLSLFPSAPDPLRLARRGDPAGVAVSAVASEALEDDEVGERLVATAADALAADGRDARERRVTYAPTASPGASLLVRTAYDRGVAGFGRPGEKGTPAEEIAERAVADARAFHAGRGAVDRYLADQLLPLLAVAGGRVAAPTTTDHLRTCRDLLEAFDRPVRTESGPEGPLLVA